MSANRLIMFIGLLACTTAALAEGEKNSQVFFRGAYSRLTTSRGGEVFTDTAGAAGTNGKKGGYSIAAGVDLALTPSKGFLNFGTLIGEIFTEYSRFSHQNVRQTTSALLAGTANSDVSVSQMNVTVAPKLRIDVSESVRPYVIPAGVAWLVNSPPSNDSTYLDMGIPFAVGVDFPIVSQLSLGADARYTYAFNHSNTHNSYYSVGAYAGINF